MGVLGDAFRSGRESSRRKSTERIARQARREGRPHEYEEGRKPLGGRTRRANPWRKCLADRCWLRVPHAQIHNDPTCKRAWLLAGPLPRSHHGGRPCCPGLCTRPDRCKRCKDRLPEVCDRTDDCGRCLDRRPQPCGCCGRCLDRTPGKCGTCGRCTDYCEGHEGEDE